ncbi:beta-ketoacyl-[acyl-carrier-protein] synthase family protein [Flavihumibacter fluvii]|uniref:beta-ketoacyl-[acyl-carrier-protein] synthase family protein n=1 Tax=Flavihumibacter fluvii TaxID=2838157 RepID=UPI001BDE39E3|nr:beta-ketoacyl-[acyl-carrier-protein] synthase family protein [Flavihumibacter fluvii]ULQ54776.1 beta-ketoacyl-[acyl-carrier-protein] synthase family protein [Flavihumibacter fluvii]
MRTVYVTGVGIVSAIGIGVAANWSALNAMTTGISYSKHLNSVLKNMLPAAEVAATTAELAGIYGDTGNLFPNRVNIMAAIALREAIKNNLVAATAGQFGFINASSVGGMGDVEDIYDALVDPDNHDEKIIPLGETMDCGFGTQELARHFNLTNFIGTISTACSSSANALIFGARLIRNGLLEGVVCGGADTLTRFTLNGFNSLKNIDKNHCRPFDANRNGLNLGEGAAYLVLESDEMLQKTGSKPLAIFSGCCNYNEAFHPTAPSPEGEGAYQAMKGALDLAGLSPEDISYINAHGTATLNNDLAEAFAFHRLFGDQLPVFSSTKCYTGHTLAAAGAIEAVFSVLSLKHQELYPVLNFDTPMPELNLVPLTTVERNIPVKHILSNSFGFGGNNASLLFSRYD